MDILICPICGKKFNDKLRKPVNAPCGHTFCEDCILKAITPAEDPQNQRTVQCPFDNEIN